VGNEARAPKTFAAGCNAKADYRGSFVWADDGGPFSSTRENEFALRASGGLYLWSNRGLRLNSADAPLITRGWDAFDATAPFEKRDHGRWGLFMEPSTLVAGIPDLGSSRFQVAKYQPNGNRTELLRVEQDGKAYCTQFVNTSDRNAKENFKPIDAREVLDAVAALPLTTWNFKSDPRTRHLGPVAQDFYAVFKVGPDDKHIATGDADGVALAAIQGLNQKLEVENATLRNELAELKALVNTLANKVNGGAK